MSFSFYNPPTLTPEQTSPFGNLMGNALKNYMNIIQAQYAQPSAEQKLQEAILQNKGLTQQQEWNPKIWQSEIGLRGAEQGLYGQQAEKIRQMLPGEVLAQNITNKYLDPMQQAELKLKEAYSHYYNMGGPGMGVGQKEMIGFKNQILTEHPELANDPQKVNDLASAYLNGQATFSDGTPVPPPSGVIRSMTDQIFKRGTTSPLLTGNIRANQAEKEIDVLDAYAQKGVEPYGTTYLGKSPQQISDSFKSDDESQTRLGRFIAAQTLQNEIAQNRTRLANGQPGITQTHDLMKLSGQMIDTLWPRLSGKARKEASRYLDEALKEGNKARQSVQTGASSLAGYQYGKPNTQKISSELGKKKDVSQMTDAELRQIAGM